MRKIILIISAIWFIDFTASYAANKAYDKDSYCLTMPRNELDYIRSTSKTYGDENEK